MESKYSFVFRGLPIAILVMGLINQLHAQDKPFLKNATIILVRHAEKDTGNNPVLNAIGHSRSGYLLSALRDNDVKKIFVTQYRRTQQTADSLRLRMKVDTIHYNADATGEGLIKMLEKHRIKNQKILIIGHSNTIPVLIGRLGISKPVTLKDDEYDTIYLIKYVKGEPMLFMKKFGDPLVQSQNTSWEEVL